MKQRKNSAKIIVIVGFIVLAAFLENLYNNATKPKMPEPAVINEPLKTYYLGNVAFDMPESWDANYNYYDFYLTEKEADGPTISFGISTRPNSSDVNEALRQKLDPPKDNATISREDISDKVGWPTVLSVFRNEKLTTKAIPPNTETSEQNLHQKKETFGTLLEVIIPEAVLRFVCTDRVAIPDEEFIDWVQNFLAHYEWHGLNAPRPGKFVMGHGSLDFSGEFKPRYSISARFSPKKKKESLSLHTSIFFTLETNAPTWSSKANRTVNGHPGEEDKNLMNLKKGFEKLKFWEPRLFMLLEWTELTEAEENFSTENPGYTFIFDGIFNQTNKQYIPEFLGVWNVCSTPCAPRPPVM
ncbi:MAG: hypothetical protein LBV79_10475 [Candidatus Adiutrix sp.]|jgi:hypothetical protein|nr:hypothetical protein [Candidatus Adiutrix sp.]